MYITSPCTDIDGSGESDGSAELVPYPSWTSSRLLAPSAQPSPCVLLDGRHQTWRTLTITIGSVCVAMTVLLLILISIVMLRLIKKYGQRKKQCISESCSPEGNA